MNTLTGAAASGGEDSPEPITPDNGAVDESLAPGGQPQLAGGILPLRVIETIPFIASLPVF